MKIDLNTSLKNNIHENSVTKMKQNLIEDMLCDLYDIQNMARLHQFGDLPKDNEGTQTTISDCIENCINHLKEIEND